METIGAITEAISLSFSRGGPVMYVILGFSLYAVTLCAERWMHYRAQHTALKTEWDPLMDEVRKKRETDELYDNKAETPAQRLIRVAINNKGLNRAELTDKIKSAYLYEVEKVDKHLSTISVTASLLPMLGLLGTVVGMVTAFNAIAQYGTGDPKMVADGISQALLTTEAGLISSIPLAFLHSNLSAKADNLIRRLDEFSSTLVHLCYEKE
jgi:biopolymer transport protein ExbB